MLRFVIYLLLLAAVLYGVFWAIDRRNDAGGGEADRPVPRGPVGPDDDEMFLRDLERRRQQESDRHDLPGDS